MRNDPDNFGTTNRRALRIKMREKAMRDGYYFNTSILGWELFYEPFHRPICDWFYQQSPTKFRMTLLPRGHFKTTIGTEGQMLWRWMKDPSLRFLLVHQKRDVAEKALQQVKDHLETNDKLKFIAPEIFWRDPHKEAKRWLRDQIDINRPKWHRVPSAMATGVDATVTGLHFNHIILDDIVTEDNSVTPEQLQHPKTFIQQVNPLLIDRVSGRVDVIGTRWHPDDAYGWLLETYSRLTSKVMACVDEKGDPVFPTKFPKDDLEATMEEMGSFQYSCLMMNNPVPSDVKMFQEAQVRFFDELPKADLTFFTAIDPNRHEDRAHDPGVVLTFARDPEGNFYEAEITHRHFNVEDLVETVRSHVVKWNPQKVIIETTAGQNYLMYWLKKEQVDNHAPYHLVPVSRGPNSHKYQRILRIQPIVERGKLHLRPGPNHLMREIKVYPFGKDDHCLDALADIVQLGYDPRVVAPVVKKPRGMFILDNIIQNMNRGKEAAAGRGLNPYGKRW